MINTSAITASEARADLYNIIRKASKGLRSFEIKLRGVEPVVLVSKEELEGWIETLDIMASPQEVAAIREGRKDKTAIPLESLLAEYESSNSQKNRRKRV